MTERVRSRLDLGKRFRRRREVGDAQEVHALTQQVAGMVTEQMAHHAIVTRFTDLAGNVYLQRHAFELQALGNRRLSVVVLVSHKKGLLHEYQDGPDLALQCRITERRGNDEENRILVINQPRDAKAGLEFKKNPPLRKAFLSVIGLDDDDTAAGQPSPLAQGGKITFLNDILMSTFDAGSTEDLFIATDKNAQTNNATPGTTVLEAVQKIFNNDLAPKIML